MNPKVNQVHLNPSLNPKAALLFAFVSLSKHSIYATHPKKCPFNYLFALKPKNPV
ncbi:hypothetical protein [Pedobacter sp. N23S346]|uniref:hypothetical protein n=1 Tax=Pedobacter sp. N23S346 TaxID=3402750 RepID=UPI003ABE15DA